MGPWLNEKCQHFSTKSGTNLLVLDDIGELIIGTEKDPISDSNNYPWRIINIDGVIDILKKIDDGSIWEA